MDTDRNHEFAAGSYISADESGPTNRSPPTQTQNLPVGEKRSSPLCSARNCVQSYDAADAHGIGSTDG